MYGFGAGVVADLVRDGLASTARGTAHAGRRSVHLLNPRQSPAGLRCGPGEKAHGHHPRSVFRGELRMAKPRAARLLRCAVDVGSRS
jgi:hypothetical protein